MINQQQLTRLVTEFKREGNLSMSAMKAGMDPKTARKYLKSGVVTLAARGPRTWRTRTDPLGAAWALAEVYLRATPELEARALFEHLLETAGEALAAGQLRTFQHRPQLAVEVIKRTDHLAGFWVLPKRWVVERTLAWLTQHRRLVRDYERSEAGATAWIYVALIRIMLRRLA